MYTLGGPRCTYIITRYIQEFQGAAPGTYKPLYRPTLDFISHSIVF